MTKQRSRIIKTASAAAAVAALTLAAATPARADIAAVWAQGHGGLANSSADGASEGSMGGLGLQLGARVLIFEGYVDRTGFGDGAAVSRGILGLRGGFGGRGVRLVLRGGAGALREEGGALTGRMPGAPDRTGGVARIGAAIESRVAPALLMGFGIDGERFALPAMGGPFGPSGTVVGSDVFATLHLMFELGV